MREPWIQATYFARDAEKFDAEIRYGTFPDWNTLSLKAHAGTVCDIILGDAQLVTLANLLEVHRARVLDDQRKAAEEPLANRLARKESADALAETMQEAPPLTDEDDPKDPFAGDL